MPAPARPKEGTVNKGKTTEQVQEKPSARMTALDEPRAMSQ